MDDKVIGTEGRIINILKKKLTQEEWNSLCVIHRMTNRLNIGLVFDWTKSIDARDKKGSQIIDESVFLSKEK